jgi:inorganic pyrophosphatase
MDVFVEVPIGSRIKYEYDHEINAIRLDRVLHNTHAYPCNYGFVPDTMTPDSDPLDIFILSDYKLLPGCVVKVKILGGIETTDEKGLDHKIISILDDKCDPGSRYVNDITDLNDSILDNIIYFLQHYKDGEIGKFVEVNKTPYGKLDALDIIAKYTL